MSQLFIGLHRIVAAAFIAVELSERWEDLDVNEERRVYLECKMLVRLNPPLE